MPAFAARARRVAWTSSGTSRIWIVLVTSPFYMQSGCAACIVLAQSVEEAGGREVGSVSNARSGGGGRGDWRAGAGRRPGADPVRRGRGRGRRRAPAAAGRGGGAADAAG